MQQELIISQLWIYPVKSLGGIPLRTTTILPKGPQHDRRWMLIDADNICMTQRVYPRMALFKLSAGADGFFIQYDEELMQLPFQSLPAPIPAKIWNDDVGVYEVSREHSEWFSTILGVRCRLVAFPENNPRPVESGNGKNGHHVSLADAYPLLVIGQRSLDDLNSRMENPLPVNRFRPNIVFTGGEAYEEDHWHNFRIGSTRFTGVKPCARCVLTTVNQDTGVKGREPLVTLSTYRREGNNIFFGQNCLALNKGEISIGERIILE